jgi:hypothetical protein
MTILNTILTPGLNNINDRLVSRHLDKNDNGIVDVGDQFESVLILDNISNDRFSATLLQDAVTIAAIENGDDPDLVANYQLTAYGLIEVAAKTDLGSGIFQFDYNPVLFKLYEDAASLANTKILDFGLEPADVTIAKATDGSLLLINDVNGTGRGGIDIDGNGVPDPPQPDKWQTLGSELPVIPPGGQVNIVGATSVVENPGEVKIAPQAALSLLVPNEPITGTGDYHDIVAFGAAQAATGPAQAQGWDQQGDLTIEFVSPEARITIAPDDTNPVGEDHTFTVTVEYNDFFLIFLPQIRA